MQKNRQGWSRPAIDRTYRIHQLLQNKEYPNCAKLAKEFEVAVRTVKRDIAFMRDRMNLPIEFDTRRNGFYYQRAVENFPQLSLSEGELFALLVAQKAVAQYQGTPFEQPLQMAFRRLTGQFDDGAKFNLGNLDEALSFHPFAPWDTDLAVFEAVTKALTQKQELRFDYRNRGTQRAQGRTVQPCHLACIQNQWYLVAFDVQHQGMRTFALARLRKAVVGSKCFRIPVTFNANDYFSGSLSVYKGDKDCEVLVDFDSWAADEVRGRRCHSTQEITELPGGMLRLRLRLNDLGEVERWLLSFGTHATVLKPAELAQRMKRTGEEYVRRY